MECNLGNLVSDAYLRHGIRDLVDGVRLNDAHIALFNAGGIRSQLPVGRYCSTRGNEMVIGMML